MCRYGEPSERRSQADCDDRFCDDGVYTFLQVWVECPRQLNRSSLGHLLVLCPRRPKRTVNELTDEALENGFRMAVISLQNLERIEAK